MKKRWLSALAAAVLILLLITPAFAAAELPNGDADGDGELTILDATAIRRHLSGSQLLSEEAVRRSMVTGADALSILDATAIQRKLAKLIDKFPIEITADPPADNSPAENDPATARISAYEQQVISLINGIRREHGLGVLEADDNLCRTARIKSQDMHDIGYFDHTSPTYGTPFEMMLAFGIHYRVAGENIAYGYRTPQAVVNGWMNSEGHRANILNGSFTKIGVGYVPDGSYWTQWFIG